MFVAVLRRLRGPFGGTPSFIVIRHGGEELRLLAAGPYNTARIGLDGPPSFDFELVHGYATPADAEADRDAREFANAEDAAGLKETA